MKNEQYSALARVYDALNSEVDYGGWASFLDTAIKKHGTIKTELVLDLACGTGAVTLPMAELGYDMTGVDLSPDMLTVARERAAEEGRSEILWLCQDMRDFELYGTVDAVVCCLDSINYLTKTEDVRKCFSLVHNYLAPNGLFLFDVNTPHKFETVYADHTYVLEADGIYCGWQNDYNATRRTCDFCLDIFSENEDGTYTRTEEIQRERAYSHRTLAKLLSECGFELIDRVSDFDFTPAAETDDRWFYVARAKK